MKRHAISLLAVLWSGICLGQTPSASPSPAQVPDPQTLVLPIPPGQGVKGLRFPNFDASGNLVSQFLAGQAMHLAGDKIKMDALRVEMYDEEGEKQFLIVLPESEFDLKTRILTSTEPVKLIHRSFELRGENLEFDTIHRTGVFHGRIYMRIHNANDFLKGSISK